MTRPIDPLVAEVVDQLDEDLREEFEERAGIVEFDGSIPRPHAECLALLDVLQRHPEAIVGLTVLEMHEGGGRTGCSRLNRAWLVATPLSEAGGRRTSVL